MPILGYIVVQTSYGAVVLTTLSQPPSCRVQGGVLLIRQGRRWHHHHQRAWYRHEVTGPEPHRGGAPGHDQRGGRRWSVFTPVFIPSFFYRFSNNSQGFPKIGRSSPPKTRNIQRGYLVYFLPSSRWLPLYKGL